MVDPTPSDMASLGQVPLDRGEITCIAVALRLDAVLVTDDRDARRVAQVMGLEISGTLGALRNLVRQDQLTMQSADELLSQMIAQGCRSPVRSIADLLRG